MVKKLLLLVEVQNGESVLIVKQPNGLKVPILEAEVR